jgi:geranylgeranyl diphosphate synthase, type II
MPSSIERYQKLIDNEIKNKKYGKEPASLYDPVGYLMGLGGKRLRPMLTVLSYSLFKNDGEKIIPYAIAVEVFHNFTLMHDDIMDKAPLRRGKPTVHKKWNVNTAILSGDVMQVKVYEILNQLDAEVFKVVSKSFNKCAIEVCEGQQWDMEFETTARVSEAQYLKMIRLKTAVLLGFCLEYGAILGGASPESRALLYDFGVNIGIGFQLKDDLMDAYADPDKFGKQVGGDILSNKKTWLLIKALEKAKGKQLTELNRWLKAVRFNKKEKVEAVKSIYDSLKIPALATKKIDQCFHRGFADLEKLPIDESGKELLKNFTQGLIQRQS